MYHFLDSIYEWYHTIIVFLSIIISRFIHVAAYGIILFFIKLSNSPLCVCLYRHIHIYTHHVFFIHSCAVGHLACFHVLAIVNRVLYHLFWFSYTLSIHFLKSPAAKLSSNFPTLNGPSVSYRNSGWGNPTLSRFSSRHSFISVITAVLQGRYS